MTTTTRLQQASRCRMMFFGTPWPAPDWPAPACDVAEGAISVLVPVGEICLHCDELIDATDSGVVTPFIGADGKAGMGAQHAECFVRSLSGPLAHLERRCICYGGTDHDTPGLTRRQEAQLVFADMCERALGQRRER